MGFSLFGRSGSNTTNQTTQNTTYDVSTVDSNNSTQNNTLDLALTRNSSFIQNDTRVQNTAIQLTDAFNRLTNYNLANVGNVNIGGTAADDAAQYAALFRSFPQVSQSGMNNATPDLNRPLLDFNRLSAVPSDILSGLNNITRSVQTGFADNTRATGNVLDAGSTGGGATTLSATVKWVLIGLVVVVGFILFRKR